MAAANGNTPLFFVPYKSGNAPPTVFIIHKLKNSKINELHNPARWEQAREREFWNILLHQR